VRGRESDAGLAAIDAENRAKSVALPFRERSAGRRVNSCYGVDARDELGFVDEGEFIGEVDAPVGAGDGARRAARRRWW
jgi:hypothetical protein